MNILAIGGEPGSGKTSLMNKLMIGKYWEKHYDKVKLVPYLQNSKCFILGKYEKDEIYGGSDKMSMACQPEVVKFLKSLQEKIPDATLIFEGDRLFNVSFLTHCLNNYDLSIYYLKTSKEIRQQRYIERNSNQNKTWLAGRETKISNILTNFDFMLMIKTYENNTLEEQNILLESIKKEINEEH